MFSRKNLFGVLGGGALALSFNLAAQADAATINVALTGGTTAFSRTDALKPGYFFRDIKRAVDSADPFDVVEVAPGNYVGVLLVIYKNNITIQAKPGSSTKPRITAPGENYSIVRINGSSYIKFLGFEVDGSDAGPNAAGVLIVPRTDANGVVTKSHHVTVSYNKIHDAGTAGIATNSNDSQAVDPVGCDYISISGNEIYNCLKTGIYGSSAISLLQDENYDSAAGYHSTIQANSIHDNVINSNNTGLQTDGNGIIIDGTGPNGPKTLIQNNLVYNNGGRGIHVFNSSNVDVLNNTCHQNVRAAGLYENGLPKSGVGEITATGSVRPDLIVRTRNVNVVNNITSSRVNVPGYVAQNSGSGPLTLDPNVKFYYNSYFGGGANVFLRGTSTTATNMFNISPGFMDAIGRNFKLANGSLAIDKGMMTKYATGTFDGLTRLNVMGAGIDLGAYERAK